MMNKNYGIKDSGNQWIPRLNRGMTNGIISLIVFSSCAMAWMLDDSIQTTELPAELVQAPDIFETQAQQTQNTQASVPVRPEPPEKLELPENLTELLQVPSLPMPEEKTKQLQKKASVLSPMEEANLKYNHAVDKINQQQEGLAEKILKEALAAYPAHTLSRVQLAKLAILKQNYAQAEDWLTESPDYFSSHPDYLRTLALVYDRNGKPKDAIQALEKMPENYRKNPDY